MIKRSSRRKDERIDVERVLRFLNYKFNDITAGFTDNSRGTPLHRYQTDFNYLVHQIGNANHRSVGNVITQANAFLVVVEEQSTTTK